MHASQALTTSLPYNYISAPRDLNFVPRTNRSHELGTVGALRLHHVCGGWRPARHVGAASATCRSLASAFV